MDESTGYKEQRLDAEKAPIWILDFGLFTIGENRASPPSSGRCGSCFSLPPKSKIRIELQRLARTEASRDWLRVRIVDEGEGIKREHLKRIFKPYFTTKDHGDETRGFGLVLAICRQIVHLHCGNLNIASEEKKGTTVQVDLPSRQINRHAPAPALHPS